MKQFLCAMLLCLIAWMPAHAQNKIEFEEFDLKNGLHVILHQDNTLPIVAVSVLYQVGSKNEKPGRTGFAHFFEHLMFEGSENIERGQFDKLLDNAGATNNANTSQDRTFYYEIMPSNQLELALWMESERMLHAKVDQKGIETQREVVKEEKRLRVDNRPYGSILAEMMKRVYTQHPYQWTPIGSMEDINAASEQDYVDFYKTFYIPNNATLSIAGDIDPKQAKKWIKAYFEGIPQGNDITRPNIKEPKQTAEIRDIIYDNIQLPAVVHGFKIPARGSSDYYAVSMLMNLLSQGESSRLSKNVKDKQQLALALGAFPFNLDDDPSVSIVFGLTNVGVKPEDMEQAIDTEYEKVKNELIGEKEFQKLQNQIETTFYSQNSSVVGIAESLADYHVYDGDANLINTEIERYMAVTREDIQRVAQEYLVKENRVSLYYLPKSDQK